MPRISIISAVFNEADFIEACMKSIAAQSFQDFEHIIVDDHSTDNTLELAHSFQTDKTVILTNPAKGKVSAFNEGFRHAKGDLIVLLAGDDTLPTESLEMRYMLMNDLDANAVAAIGRGHVKTFSNDQKFNGLVIPKHNRGNFSGGCVVLTRKLSNYVFEAPIELPNEDTWLRLCARFFADDTKDSPGVTLNYRIHERNSSGSRVGFEKAKNNYARRMTALQLFKDRFEAELSESDLQKLQIDIDLEAFRCAGQTWKILSFTKAPMLDRLRAISYASPIFYNIRMLGWRVFTGWR